MEHAASRKFCLMTLHWLEIQEIKQRVPKDKRSQCNTSDEEVVSLSHNRIGKVNIKHDPKILISVLTLIPGIENYQ